MLNLASIAKWMRGISQREMTYGLPESVYDDIVPSGMHRSKFAQF